MLNLTDLNTNQALDKAEMSDVRGGSAPRDLLAIVNAPEIDLGTHVLFQKQAVAVDQSGNIGGVNWVDSDQTQNGIAGQVAG